LLSKWKSRTQMLDNVFVKLLVRLTLGELKIETGMHTAATTHATCSNTLALAAAAVIAAR